MCTAVVKNYTLLVFLLNWPLSRGYRKLILMENKYKYEYKNTNVHKLPKHFRSSPSNLVLNLKLKYNLLQDAKSRARELFLAHVPLGRN